MKSCILTSTPVKERLEKAAEEKEAMKKAEEKEEEKEGQGGKSQKKGYIKWSRMT